MLKAFGDTPFGFSITPENTNVLTPLDSGPDVVIYDTSTLDPLSTFLPKTPSPNKISYLSSSISSMKKTFDVESTFKILSATRYDSLKLLPEGYTFTLIVLVSMFWLSRTNLCDFNDVLTVNVLRICVPSLTSTLSNVATLLTTCPVTSSNVMY